jgi:membrane protein implicated in regulation of membrane protease activity
MSNAFVEKLGGEPIADAAVPLGRVFVMGSPSLRQLQSIFLGGRLWRIAPGDFQAGDRVEVIACDDEDRLVLRVI